MWSRLPLLCSNFKGDSYSFWKAISKIILNYFQDDFLDLADDTHHVQAAEMALCLSPTTGSSATGTTTMTCPKTVTASDDLQQVNQLVDNPVMKLDNLDSWDQDV